MTTSINLQPRPSEQISSRLDLSSHEHSSGLYHVANLTIGDVKIVFFPNGLEQTQQLATALRTLYEGIEGTLKSVGQEGRSRTVSIFTPNPEAGS